MKVKFMPLDKELEIEPNQSIMDLAHKNGIHISSVCNGMPSCAECRIKVVQGEANMLPPGAKELSLIGTGHFIDQRRLSCQCLCFGDVTVDLTEQVEKASEAKVNKKFLKRAQIENPEDSYSQGGILIEQDADLMKQERSDTAGNDSEERNGSAEGGNDKAGKSEGGNRNRRRRRRRPSGKRGGGGPGGGGSGSGNRKPKSSAPKK